MCTLYFFIFYLMSMPGYFSSSCWSLRLPADAQYNRLNRMLHGEECSTQMIWKGTRSFRKRHQKSIKNLPQNFDAMKCARAGANIGCGFSRKRNAFDEELSENMTH
jgi:hypothetical protein